MKNSTKRFLLLTWSLFPALIMCGMFGLMGLLDTILRHRTLDNLLVSGSFCSCIVIYIVFLLDTLRLYKDNK